MYSHLYPCPHRENGIATERFDLAMEKCATSLRRDGVLVVDTCNIMRARERFALETFAKSMEQGASTGHTLTDIALGPRIRKQFITCPRNFPGSFLDPACGVFDDMARDTPEDMCRSLGFKSTALDDLLDEAPLPRDAKGASEIMAVCYDAAALPGHDKGAEAHVDRSILTLIYSDRKEGLSVRRPDGSGWLEVELGPNKVAVIPGQTLQHALGGEIVATTHAVELRSVPRHALVYRMKAREDAIISPATPPKLAQMHPRKSAKAQNDAFEQTQRSVNRPPAAASSKRKEPATERQVAPAAVRQRFVCRTAESGTLGITVRDQDNALVQFNVLYSTKFDKVFNAFCSAGRHWRPTPFAFRSTARESIRRRPRGIWKWRTVTRSMR